MTRVLFLHGARDRYQAAAEWLAESIRQGTTRVVVYAPEEEALSRIDTVLWTTPPTGFTPHCRAESAVASETPIVLSTSTDECGHEDCLLNLGNEIPPGFAKFDQLIEVVGTKEDSVVSGRARYKFYRDRGYPLEARDLSASLT